MHVPDGILPLSVTAAGYAITGAMTWYSLRKINQQENPRQDIPKASLLTAAFFVASWIHIPVPPASVHLILNGLLGVILGYYAFPAILIGLLFQAVMFQHGGLTTLGVNAAMMGIPALLAHHVFNLRWRLGKNESPAKVGIFAFLGGSLGMGLAVLIFFGLLVTSIPTNIDVAAERTAITVLSVSHIPVVILEGVFTALLGVFLLRVKPALLGGFREARA